MARTDGDGTATSSSAASPPNSKLAGKRAVAFDASIFAVVPSKPKSDRDQDAPRDPNRGPGDTLTARSLPGPLAELPASQPVESPGLLSLSSAEDYSDLPPPALVEVLRALVANTGGGVGQPDSEGREGGGGGDGRRAAGGVGTLQVRRRGAGRSRG